MSGLAGQAALVTGGSRGIGAAVVRRLAADGCDVAFNYHARADAAEALCGELASAPGRVRADRVDVRDFEAVKGWAAAVKDDFGRLDLLVNNAGIVRDGALMTMSAQDWRAVLDTNLDGMFHAARACVVSFLKQRRGCIINVSSVSGITGLPRQVNYSASKGGMNAFTRALAKEVAAYGVRVNAVAPGFIDTEILDGLDGKFREGIAGQIPLGRIGRPGEVAALVHFLAGERASYITGQIIPVDGGLVIR